MQLLQRVRGLGFETERFGEARRQSRMRYTQHHGVVHEQPRPVKPNRNSALADAHDHEFLRGKQFRHPRPVERRGNVVQPEGFVDFERDVRLGVDVFGFCIPLR